MSDEKDIIINLLETTDEFVPTLTISKAVFGDGATKKMINKFLYALEKQGKVEKRCEPDGTKPEWRLKQK